LVELPGRSWYPGDVTSSASERAAGLAGAQVGTEPVEKVLRESGMVPTEAGKARWREALRRPIPEEALAEGRRLLAEARAEVHGSAA
jgi:hypothetical protein